MINIRRILFFLSLLPLYGVQGALPDSFLQKEDTLFVVQAIHNASERKAWLGNTEDYKIIPEKRGLSLVKGLKIPFISIKNYIWQYATNAPYVPQHALKIKTHNGFFCIWESEDGVICAPDPKKSDLDPQWNMQLLFKINKRAHRHVSPAVLKLLLLINKQGKLSLKQLHPNT